MAGDAGARTTVQAVADALPGCVVLAPACAIENWEDVLRRDGVDLLICGTSDGAQGRALEESAQRGAAALDIPVVQIEDYPGNFRPGAGARCDLLVADGEFSARLAISRWADRCPPTLALPSPRYDFLRQLPEVREPTRAADAHTVLWAGQPETEDSRRTLERCLPLLAQHDCALLFRAHPRDSGYVRGVYTRLLDEAGIAVRDVTSINWEACLRMAPALILTQFSSLAVEAGFSGIPALHVLYPDLGGATLQKKKGYPVPPWCLFGASFLIRDTGEAASQFCLALTSEASRQAALRAFEAYFCTGVPTAPRVLNHLYNLRLIDILPPQ